MSSEPSLDPTGQLWWDHMLAGDFESAWQITDVHRAANLADPDRMWDGSPIDGRHLMLRCLHGFGDSIMLLRYAPLLRARTASLTVEVNPHFVPLARCIAGIDRVVTWGEDAPASPVSYDVQIEINELPYFFRTTLESIPPALNLDLPSEALARARAALASVPRPRIGLAWESSEWDRSRSVPLPQLLEALQTTVARTGASLISLQMPADEDASGWTTNMRMNPRLDTANRWGVGLVPLACAVAQLDLVVSVDTMAAHLAGTLGRPTLLLLQHNADWRWMRERTRSPWYPAIHLLRQTAPTADTSRLAGRSTAEWQPVLSQLTSRLISIF